MPSLCSSSVMFVVWHLSSMPPSINKQFLLSCHLCGLCFHSEPFYFLSSIAISVTSISLTSLSPPGPHPAPPLLYPVHQTTLPSRSIIILWTVIPVTFPFFPSLPLSTTRCSASQMDMQFWLRACALCRILNPKAQPDAPSSTESVYLGVTAIPSAAGCIRSPHLFPRSHLIVMSTAALRWESGNYILQSVIPTCTP